MICSAARDRFPVGTGGRWLLLAWSLFLLGGFALAWRLEPDPRGFGTHERLGLPPCTLRALSGIPCPACGMTTSFACLTHGEFSRALHANVGGVLLALICAVQIPWCWWSAARARLIGVSEPKRAFATLAAAVALVSAANWVWQIVR